MSKENPTDFYANWYELWMKQSKAFFDTADKNLKDMFGKNALVNPEEHMEQINAWLESLKKQWQQVQHMQLNEEQKLYAAYWQSMGKMCQDASEMMMKQWMQRMQGEHPIKNVQELYELWLNCCHEVYQKAMHTKAYQDTYAEFINAAMKFWKSYMPKQ